MKTVAVVAGALALVVAGISVTVPIVYPAAAQAQTATVPNFEMDPLFFQNLPNRWTTGQVGGISVDTQDHVWVLHRPATVAEGEKSASLNPPAALCCIPAPPILELDQNVEITFGIGLAAGY